MISRISGELIEVREHWIELKSGDFTYEILIPAYLSRELLGKIGQTMELHIHHYLEGGAGSPTMVPRLVGFKSRSERELFEQMVKVPGLGSRKVLKALIVPPGQLARAVETEDSAALSSLPGVGKRTADKIVATLKGKLTDFAFEAGAPTSSATPAGPLSETEEEAAIVLTQLGYKPAEAAGLIKLVMKHKPDLDQADAIVRAALQAAGSEAVR